MIEPRLLEGLVERGLSTADIAAELDAHPKVVGAWLQEFGLQTEPQVRGARVSGQPADRRTGTCPKHGASEFVARKDGSWRCVTCRSEQVSASRRRRKARLVAEAGGCCIVCGYDRCIGALAFHHVDPSTKKFGVSYRGLARSLERARAEMAKCVLLCANCHAEVESGLVKLPIN